MATPSRFCFKYLPARVLRLLVSSLVLCVFIGSSGWAAAPATSPDKASEVHKGSFLIATKNLTGSSFQETVILITNYNSKGTTGIAINRPTTLTLKEAYPDVDRFKDGKDILYLGGPVRPDTVFVLLKSGQPHRQMQHIGGNVYFSPGITAMTNGKNTAGNEESARAYAGYTGWAPGQLESEIQNGDWLVIKADLNIIFSKQTDSVWKTLLKAWSGTWI